MRTGSDLIILDLEWNQPFGRKNMIMSPVPLTGEIIRVGAVKADRNYNVVDTLNLFVRPKYYKKINYAVEKVTGLTGSDISYGARFPGVYEKFRRFCGDDPLIFTWGTEDEKVMRSNLAVHHMDFDLPSFLDLQVFFSRRAVKSSEQYSVTSALEYFGLETDLKAHDALNDAIYTYRVAREMDIFSLIPEYPDILREIEEEKAARRRQRYRKVFSGIDDPDDVPDIRRMVMCRCPDCRGRMQRTPLERISRLEYTAEAVCDKCGSFTVTFSLSEAEEGKYDAVRSFAKKSITKNGDEITT